jgi:hypothetical protein
MSEYDYRQLLLMQEALDSFNPVSGDLAALAGQLLNLRDVLECIDRSWDHEFTQAVATLDSASETTPVQRHAMGDQFAGIVSAAVLRLRELVADALSRHSDLPVA